MTSNSVSSKAKRLAAWLLFLAISPLFMATACEEETFIPRPRGYFRLEFPDKSYEPYQSECPFSFEKPTYSVMMKAKGYSEDNCQLNLEMPHYKATVHISYRPINNDLNEYLESCRSMAYEHRVRASGIDEIPQLFPERNVYGLAYNIRGEVASNYQFYVTDSTNHFLRGSLYFYAIPNEDSLAPSLDFIKKDLEHLMETVEWNSPN